MSSVEFSEKEFNKKASELVKVSEVLDDNWQLNEKDSKLYMSKKTIVEIGDGNVSEGVEGVEADPSVVVDGYQSEVMLIEYHVLFHPSYQVPALYFNAYSDSSLITLNDLSKVFRHEFEADERKTDLSNIITQAEHPILFRPFFMLHPCKVNDVLTKFAGSKNFVLTFLSIFGPFVRLKMSNEYQKFFET